jgi:alcohol dehydrogenase YqhD (iron-dependent ADH family)
MAVNGLHVLNEDPDWNAGHYNYAHEECVVANVLGNYFSICRAQRKNVIYVPSNQQFKKSFNIDDDEFREKELVSEAFQIVLTFFKEFGVNENHGEHDDHSHVVQQGKDKQGPQQLEGVVRLVS